MKNSIGDIVLMGTIVLITMYLIVNNPYTGNAIQLSSEYLNRALKAVTGS